MNQRHSKRWKTAGTAKLAKLSVSGIHISQLSFTSTRPVPIQMHCNKRIKRKDVVDTEWKGSECCDNLSILKQLHKLNKSLAVGVYWHIVPIGSCADVRQYTYTWKWNEFESPAVERWDNRLSKCWKRGAITCCMKNYVSTSAPIHSCTCFQNSYWQQHNHWKVCLVGYTYARFYKYHISIKQ